MVTESASEVLLPDKAEADEGRAIANEIVTAAEAVEQQDTDE